MMSEDTRITDVSDLTVLAEQAGQMHQDLLAMLCAGALGSPGKPGLGWEKKAYALLVKRVRAVLVEGPALDLLTQQGDPGTAAELCLAFGQLAATLRVFRDEVDAAQGGQMGFRPA